MIALSHLATQSLVQGQMALAELGSLLEFENHGPLLPSAESEYAFPIRSPDGSPAR